MLASWYHSMARSLRMQGAGFVFGASILLRHSPAVTYPLRRSRLVHGLWLLLMVSSAMVLLLWSWLGAGDGQAWWVRIGAAALVWLLCAGLGWTALQRQPLGALHWSGTAWAWQLNGQSQPLTGVPVVLWDVQWLLVLGFIDERQRMQRLVLQRNWAPHSWADLRRAVYSSAHPPQNAASSEVH